MTLKLAVKSPPGHAGNQAGLNAAGHQGILVFSFVPKDRDDLIHRRLIGVILENVPALLGTSENNLMRMPWEDLLAALRKRHLSESSMASQIVAQVKGSPAMMAAVVQEASTATSSTMQTWNTGVTSTAVYRQELTKVSSWNHLRDDGRDAHYTESRE